MRNLPPIYDELLEAQALTETATNEVELLDVAKKRVQNEQFIMTSSEPFIRKRELGYDIRSDPTTETMDFRRKRLIARQSARLPITQRKVNEIVKGLVGTDNFEERLNVEACETLFIFDATEEAVSREVDLTLDRIIPLNMKLSIARRVKKKFYVPAALCIGAEVTLHPMPIGNISISNKTSSSGYTQVTREITINPL